MLFIIFDFQLIMNKMRNQKDLYKFKKTKMIIYILNSSMNVISMMH